jgi:hypothetical protein
MKWIQSVQDILQWQTLLLTESTFGFIKHIFSDQLSQQNLLKGSIRHDVFWSVRKSALLHSVHMLSLGFVVFRNSSNMGFVFNFFGYVMA